MSVLLFRSESQDSCGFPETSVAIVLNSIIAVQKSAIFSHAALPALVSVRWTECYRLELDRTAFEELVKYPHVVWLAGQPLTAV